MQARHLDYTKRLQMLIDLALEEDLGAEGDVSSLHFVPETTQANARVVAREAGVLAGMEAMLLSFSTYAADLTLTALAKDGDSLRPQQAILEITGPARSLLPIERIALNFVQRLSGIATATRACVDAVAGTHCQILDTRKTTPAWRLLEKAAVKAGGGQNHRMGLYDRVMLKDNHLLSLTQDIPALTQAITDFHAKYPHIPIQLEADTLEQVEQFLTLPSISWILLDNMSNEQMAKAVKMRDHAHQEHKSTKIQLEGSGNMSLERLPDAAATGIDAISLGALTHSVRALDFGLDFS